MGFITQGYLRCLTFSNRNRLSHFIFRGNCLNNDVRSVNEHKSAVTDIVIGYITNFNAFRQIDISLYCQTKNTPRFIIRPCKIILICFP